jgi:Na+/proline symporter
MGFSGIDYIVLAVYLVGITVFGTLFRRSQRTVKDYCRRQEDPLIVISLDRRDRDEHVDPD